MQHKNISSSFFFLTFFTMYRNGCHLVSLNHSLESLTLQTLSLKAPITTAADDINKYFFIVFRENKMMFQVNPLLGREFT